MKKILITIAAFLFGFVIVNAQTPGGINVMQGGTGLTYVPNTWCLTGSTSPLHLYASPCLAGEPLYIAASSTLLRFGTTTDTLTEGTNKFYTDAKVATYIVGSSTIPKGLPTLGNVFLGNGSQWTSVATSSLGITGGGASLSGGTTNALTYWTSPTTVGATTSPVVGYITATSTNATSTFLGNVMIGNSILNGNIGQAGGILNNTLIPFQVSSSVNDLVNVVSVGNTNMGNLAAGCYELVNGGTTYIGLPSSNYSVLCLSGQNFNNVYVPGYPPNSTLLVNSDASLLFAALSSNVASSTIAWGIGPGYTAGNYDMVFRNISGAIAGTGFGTGLGIGTTSPTASLSIEIPTGVAYPILNLDSINTFTGVRNPILKILPNGNIGIGSSSPSNPLEVNGNTFLGGNLTTTGTLSVASNTTLGNASSTNLTIGTNGYITPLISTFLAVDASHKIIATTTPLFTETEPLYTAASSTLLRAGTTTDALTEGSNNLFWTNNRFDIRLNATTSLPNLGTLAGLFSIGSSTGVTTILGKTVMTNASTTNLSIGTDTYLTGLTSTYLSVNAAHKIIATTTPLLSESLYVAASSTIMRTGAVTATYPVQSTGGVTPIISLAFGTTTSNTWAGVQTFTNASSTALTATTLYGGGANITGTPVWQSFTYATSTWAGTTTIPLEVAWGETWQSANCFTDAGSVYVDFYRNSLHLNLFQVTTGTSTNTLSSNNVTTAGDKVYVALGTPASSPTKITCTVKKNNP